ncbi:hypothetical protein HPB51_016684 [Rhipicephalus microplus]|uniref:Uncharacterized protein n=1 Tax=Rhipicephalus microplus TaxID=6941 RepID=A0A9J6DIH9_RHIMP|nr:hypothetical protein HPB51_016684 [Rhipicephalus microplus]
MPPPRENSAPPIGSRFPPTTAKVLAQAMMPPPGALPARPVRNPKDKRGASFGGIPFVQLESLQSWTLQESRDNMVMALTTAAADAVRRLSQASRGHAMCTSAPAAAEEEMDMSASRKRPRPQDSSDDEADTRRKLAQGNPKGESDSSADSSDSRLSYDSQHTEDSIDSSASSTTTGVASVIQVDPCTVTMGPPGVPAIDASEGMDEALHHETVSPHPAAAFLKDATSADTTGKPRRKRNRNRRRRRRTVPALQSAALSPPSSGSQCKQTTTTGPSPTPHTALRHAAAPTTETVDHEGFQTVRSKAALRRIRNRTSAALPVDPAVKGTVLYRPASAGGSFQNCPRLTIAQALWLHPGVAAIRVNQHRNVVAVDVTSQECLVKLLALTELKGIPVTTRQPADRRTSMGFIHGVDGDAADENLLSGLQSAVRVLSASREGRTVTLRFEGLVPPDHVTLFRVRFPVRPARPRPLQGRQCGRYGHVRETCNWPGQLHPLRPVSPRRVGLSASSSCELRGPSSC